MSPRTTYLSRLLGLYYILVELAMAGHKQATVEMVKAIMQSPAAIIVAGLLALAIGLAMVLAHNVWTGGALPVIVTLLGWASLIKGLVFLFLSPEAVAALFLGALHYEQLYYSYSVFSLLLGIYLTYGGFRSASR